MCASSTNLKVSFKYIMSVYFIGKLCFIVSSYSSDIVHSIAYFGDYFKQIFSHIPTDNTHLKRLPVNSLLHNYFQKKP